MVQSRQIQLQQPSVTSLYIEPHGPPGRLGNATGFLVGHGETVYLVTNWHVVAGRHPTTGQPLSQTGALPERLMIAHNKAVELGNWVRKTEELLETDGFPRWLEHPQGPDGAIDVVALPLVDLSDVEVMGYDPKNPGPSIAVLPSAALNIIGFPFGVTGGGLAILSTFCRVTPSSLSTREKLRTPGPRSR